MEEGYEAMINSMNDQDLCFWIDGNAYADNQYYGSISHYWRHNYDEVIQRKGDSYILHKPNGKNILLRMVEQICHIEHYRNELLQTEGREISSEVAAKEWIEKYAHTFPGA